MRSCIYTGKVWHQRLVPVRHGFRYRLFLMYLDLEELPDLFAPYMLWSAQRPNVAWWRRRDHLGPAYTPLPDAVRQLVHQQAGIHLDGPVRLLTHLCYWGIRFNPISLYYCYDAAGRNVCAIVAEVSNIPWREQHHYVLPVREPAAPGTEMRFDTAKRFHVSPFMGMEQSYRWRLTVPSEQLSVNITNIEAGTQVFHASMELRRVQIGHGSLARVLLQYPWMTAKVIAAIHYQAFRLWLKRCPFHPHPGGLRTPASE